jgi:hypothetical protein
MSPNHSSGRPACEADRFDLSGEGLIVGSGTAAKALRAWPRRRQRCRRGNPDDGLKTASDELFQAFQSAGAHISVQPQGHSANRPGNDLRASSRISGCPMPVIECVEIRITHLLLDCTSVFSYCVCNALRERKIMMRRFRDVPKN